MVDAIPQEQGRSEDRARGACYVLDAMVQRYALECWQSVFANTKRISEVSASKESVAEISSPTSSTPVDLRKSLGAYGIGNVTSGSKRPAEAASFAAPADSSDISANRPGSRVRWRSEDGVVEHAPRLARDLYEDAEGITSGSADETGKQNGGPWLVAPMAIAFIAGGTIERNGAATPHGVQTQGLHDLKNMCPQLNDRVECKMSGPPEAAEEPLAEMPAGLRSSHKRKIDVGSDQTIFITRSESGLTLAICQDKMAGVALLNAVLPAAYLLPRELASLSRIVVNGRVVYQRDAPGVADSPPNPPIRKLFSFSC